MKTKKSSHWIHAVLCGVGLATAISSTGCQTTIAGQTLPSPHYFKDDVQYFAPGPKFKLAKEAAAMKQYNAEEALRQK